MESITAYKSNYELEPGWGGGGGGYLWCHRAQSHRDIIGTDLARVDHFSHRRLIVSYLDCASERLLIGNTSRRIDVSPSLLHLQLVKRRCQRVLYLIQLSHTLWARQEPISGTDIRMREQRRRRYMHCISRTQVYMTLYSTCISFAQFHRNPLEASLAWHVGQLQ